MGDRKLQRHARERRKLTPQQLADGLATEGFMSGQSLDQGKGKTYTVLYVAGGMATDELKAAAEKSPNAAVAECKAHVYVLRDAGAELPYELRAALKAQAR
jgi:hypothetical protein